jgi:acetyl-CoA decarbonylase/synthase complex subunit gamma
MAELSGLQIFKYLPAAKKLAEGNCKKCGLPTCMAYALKLAKGQTETELCPHLPEELKEIFTQSMKKPQKELFLGDKNKVTVGGENVLFRHDKTFINKTIVAVVLDTDKNGIDEILSRIADFEINRVNEIFRCDLVYLKGTKITSELTQKLDTLGFAWVVEEDLKEITIITDAKDTAVDETVEILTKTRRKAILEKDENYSNPVAIYFEHNENLLDLMARASIYLCKYANMLIFEDFDEALFSTVMTLRQNIYTDPQKPLQVESKVYEFNNPDENALVFLTTNFALTYFAVANEIEDLNKPAYLIVTPSDGMSVLTAWSAEKFTAQIAAKTVNNAKIADKIKNKQIIIPGLLAHMKDEIKEALPEFDILVGPNEAYLLGDFVKSLIQR